MRQRIGSRTTLVVHGVPNKEVSGLYRRHSSHGIQDPGVGWVLNGLYGDGDANLVL